MSVAKTQIVKYIRKGDKGDPGNPGAKGDKGAVMRGPQIWDDCANAYIFQAGGTNEEFLDVVIYNNQYYVCKKSHSKVPNNYPGSGADVVNGYWQLGDKVDMVATKILMAQYALVKNLGVEAIEMRDANNNILFQAKNGNVICKTGTFENVNVGGDLNIKRLNYQANQVDSSYVALSTFINIETIPPNPGLPSWAYPYINLPYLYNEYREINIFIPTMSYYEGIIYPQIISRDQMSEIFVPANSSVVVRYVGQRWTATFEHKGYYKFVGYNDGSQDDYWYLVGEQLF